MEKHRILYMAKTSTGGSAISLYRLISGLDNSRYTSMVLFYLQENPDIVSKLAELGVKVFTLEEQRQEHSPASSKPVKRRDIARWLRARCGEWASRLYVFLKSCYQFVRQDVPRIWPMMRIIRDREVDLVHLNINLRHDKAGIIAAWVAGVPCVCHVRMFHELSPVDRVAAKLVDRFVFISSAIAESYIAQGVSSAKGTIVHDAADLEASSLTYNVASAREEFGLAVDDWVVGNVGRLDWWKGHEFFLEAMAEVARTAPSLKCLIVGESDTSPRNLAYLEKLQSLTKSLDLSDRVIFTGFRSDVPRIMSLLDVGVHSSSQPEPFGMVVIEGMAASKPVVATAAGGVLDIIEDGVNGLLVPCKDSKAMAGAVLRLFSDREMARQMGLAARRRVEEKFTVQHHAAGVQRLYDSLSYDSPGESPDP